MSDKLSSHVTD